MRLERFSPEWLAKYAVRDPETGCILWTGFACKLGYVRTWYQGKDGVLLHRVAYESAFGQFDPSLKVCHRCDRPRCFNPEHLFLGTQKDNLRDMFAKGRARPRGRTPKGSSAGVVSGSKELEKDCLSHWHSTSSTNQLDDSAMLSLQDGSGASDSGEDASAPRPKWWTVELPQKPWTVTNCPDTGADVSAGSRSLPLGARV